MKKLLILLLLPVFGFAQYEFSQSVNISVKDAYAIKSFALSPPGDFNQEIANVPTGEAWYIASNGWQADAGTRFYVKTNDPITGEIVTQSYGGFPEGMWSEGTILYARYNSGNNTRFSYVIYKFRTSELLLADNLKSEQQTPILFPNPTSSLLALNSDKEYDIEVYDMLGNKLMALTGNSINMEHLSTATYIVKATDKSNNEELTYKVVKN